MSSVAQNTQVGAVPLGQQIVIEAGRTDKIRGLGSFQEPFLPALVAGFALLYFLAAKLGIATSLPPEGIVVVWPANAIILVALLKTQPKHWWAFFVATIA